VRWDRGDRLIYQLVRRRLDTLNGFNRDDSLRRLPVARCHRDYLNDLWGRFVSGCVDGCVGRLHRRFGAFGRSGFDGSGFDGSGFDGSGFGGSGRLVCDLRGSFIGRLGGWRGDWRGWLGRGASGRGAGQRAWQAAGDAVGYIVAQCRPTGGAVFGRCHHICRTSS